MIRIQICRKCFEVAYVDKNDICEKCLEEEE